MKREHRGASLLLAVHVMSSMAGCAPAPPPPRPTADALAGIRRLAIVAPPAPPFAIVDARLRPASPGALGWGSAFGFLGLIVAATVTSAAQERADETHGQGMAAHVHRFQAHVVVRDALQRRVLDAARFEAVEAMDVAPTRPAATRLDAVVHVAITAWGLRLTPTRERDELTGFVDLATRMVLTRNDREVWNEALHAAGQRRHTLQEYGADADLLSRELTETLQAAAQRVAVDLIYPREGR